MTSINVSLPEELKEFAEAQTKRGYSTPSEYIEQYVYLGEPPVWRWRSGTSPT
ncbi:MAG TPA: hypothetical protein VG675_03540 [Bryobacteraceae bacterium]|nr:hypothetical protein [Bryobacteraceae bacterium]